MMRIDGRRPEQARQTRIQPGILATAEGSALIEVGNTKVICTATVESTVPGFLKGSGRGWITAEYSMLPGSSDERIRREARAGRQSGRTQEIQRLLGRSLRAVCDLRLLGERSVTVDCDVLQADGGTRVASICGGYVALHDALSRLDLRDPHPLRDNCAAVSVAVLGNRPLLDPDYREDVAADVDMNVVMTGAGDLIEVQGTAEGAPFSRKLLGEMLDLAAAGTAEIVRSQQETLSGPLPSRPAK